MDSFWFFIFWPAIGLFFLVVGGGAMLYFFLGLQNLYVGIKENSQVKRKSGAVSMLISTGLVALLLLSWVPFGGKIFFFWLY